MQAISHKSFFFAAYAQDDWKVTPRVTLNLGVRYDQEALVNNCCWDTSRTYKILKDIGHPYGKLPKTDNNNYAPRVGLRNGHHHVGVFFQPGTAADGLRSVSRGEFCDRFWSAGELRLRRQSTSDSAVLCADVIPPRW